MRTEHISRDLKSPPFCLGYIDLGVKNVRCHRLTVKSNRFFQGILIIMKRGCRTNVRQLILYIQHKTPSFEKPGVCGIISLCD